MGDDFTEYAKQIPRIKQLIDAGWELFLVDYVYDEYLFERYKKIKLMSGGTRNKRKVKKVYMRKKETAWFEHLARHITFGWRTFEWKSFEKDYESEERISPKPKAAAPKRKTAPKARQPPTPALIDENVALRRSEGGNLARQDKMFADLDAALSGGVSAKPKRGLVSQKEHELGKTLRKWGEGVHTEKPAKPAKGKAKKTAPAGITLTAAQKKRLAAKGSITIKRGGKFVTVRE